MNCPVFEPPCIPLCPTPHPSKLWDALVPLGWGGTGSLLLFTQCLQASILPGYELQTPQQTMLSRINQCCRLPSARPWGAELWRTGMQELQSAAPVTLRMLAMLARLKRPRKLRSTKPSTSVYVQ